METHNSFNQSKGKDRPKLLVLCLLTSLLLHVVLVLSLPKQQLHPSVPILDQQQPTIVRLVDKPKPLKKLEYELDQKLPETESKPPEQASRLAEQNQRVEKEQAPKGEDFRDQQARKKVTPPRPAAPRKKPVIAKQKPLPATPKPSPAAPKPAPKRPTSKTGTLAKQQPGIAAKQPPPSVSKQLPSLDLLTQLTPNTLERLAKSERAVQEKIKQREDVDEGDTVWLNLERGMLISFFRRFRNQVEGVWNYPAAAAQREIQGILQLKITVNRKGELLDVDLVKSSGYDILDFEAIQAVYRAAPFGPLPKHYPHPDLKINAHFRYQITGKYIYGRH